MAKATQPDGWIPLTTGTGRPLTWIAVPVEVLTRRPRTFGGDYVIVRPFGGAGELQTIDSKIFSSASAALAAKR